MFRSLGIYLVLAAGALAALAWLAAWRTTPAPGRLYRGAAWVALSAFIFGCGLAYGPAIFVPQPPVGGGPSAPAEPGEAPGAVPLPSPDDAAPPNAGEDSADSAVSSAGDDTTTTHIGPEFELTFQPPLSPALAEAMAEAERERAERHPLDGQTLATGEVVIESVDAGAERVLLHNRSGYAVDLSGWALFAKDTSSWCYFPEGLVLAAGARLAVVSGAAVAVEGLPVGTVAAAGDCYAWTEDEVIPGSDPVPAAAGTGLILYDRTGNIRSRY